jgi:large subunit ribosomal protein L15
MNLPKTITRRVKRLGQGYGTGKGGHTSGRGTKGQKARRSMGVLFEGLKVRKSLYKRLPLKRGKDKFKANKKPLVVDIALLNTFTDGDTISMVTLVKAGIVTEKETASHGVKILGTEGLSKKLKVVVPTSRSAKAAIEKAGGSVERSSKPVNKDTADTK